MANDHNAVTTKKEGGRLVTQAPEAGKGCQCDECTGKSKAAKKEKES